MKLSRWKLSSRERKKRLEDSLKSSDYSEHHLIPFYGFRCADDSGNVGVEERRVELRRLEARALAAERAALERRARAEGGAGGAAFARAMSRRALARAEWIQKVFSHKRREINVKQTFITYCITVWNRSIELCLR